MRRIANIFLILFLCAGIVSLVNAVVLLLATSSPLAAMRSLLALLVGLAAIPMYLCLGIDKRLPKWIFLPQLLFIFWSIFNLWPLPLMFDRTHYMLPAALVQVLLGVAPLLYLKKKSGGQWLLPADMFSGPFFGWKHSAAFFIANLIISPLVLAYMVFSFASLQLYEQSGGFARLWPSGLQMTEKIYRRADKEIHLTGMIHIAVNPRGIDRFVLLPAGKPHSLSTELLGSPRMCDLVKELTSKYPKRIIIFDLPSILTTADAMAFIPCVDCSLVVVEDDVTKESDLKAAIEMLSITNVIGTVLNKSMY